MTFNLRGGAKNSHRNELRVPRYNGTLSENKDASFDRTDFEEMSLSCRLSDNHRLYRGRSNNSDIHVAEYKKAPRMNDSEHPFSMSSSFIIVC
ncbi:hypothetical protein F2P81_002753 [Scophthalmus maximus]|uniref:Uncharacterized protein n=1 Tax=Scophthalmus maximus TaxID=52904 RepID=A0A6A4TSK8_SCOMX|nr:hypothetical protein F2P81_002753 [Scophthalmus maximus]